MSTAEEASNKATVRRFDDVVSTGDAEVISKTIDELVEPDVLIRIPLPIQATGAQALKQVWAMLLRGLPDLHVAVEDVIAEGDSRLANLTGSAQEDRQGRKPTSDPQAIADRLQSKALRGEWLRSPMPAASPRSTSCSTATSSHASAPTTKRRTKEPVRAAAGAALRFGPAPVRGYAEALVTYRSSIRRRS
jgi:ketosteroid isomerase-like protein